MSSLPQSNTQEIIAQAEKDTLAEILTWVKEVVDGSGKSKSQIIVTLVLGCLPGVGQVIDVYNLLNIVFILIHENKDEKTEDNEDIENWIELVTCVIAFVPVFGDALKIVFRNLREGTPIGRILDNLSICLHGDIEKWFRELDWSDYSHKVDHQLTKILDLMIEAFDSFTVECFLDKKGLKRLIEQLKDLKKTCKQKAMQAMEEIRKLHLAILPDPLPATTAHTNTGMFSQSHSHQSASGSTSSNSGSSSTSASNQSQSGPPGTIPAGSQSSRIRIIYTNSNDTPPMGATSATHRTPQRSRYDPKKVEDLGEHIADEYFVNIKKTRKKLNNLGILYGHVESMHHGIDHVWEKTGKSDSLYRISDTKGTNAPYHKRLETPIRNFRTFDFGIDFLLNDDAENRAFRSLGKPINVENYPDECDMQALGIAPGTQAKQMSHLWIYISIQREKLVDDKIRELIKDWYTKERVDLGKCPYERSIIVVTGENLIDHERRTEHRISTDIVLPPNIITQ